MTIFMDGIRRPPLVPICPVVSTEMFLDLRAFGLVVGELSNLPLLVSLSIFFFGEGCCGPRILSVQSDLVVPVGVLWGTFAISVAGV